MINYTIPIIERSPQYICELNQLELLNHVSKFPKIALYFILASTIIYTINLLIMPKLPQEWYKHLPDTEFLGFITLLTGVFFMIFTTYNITSETIKTIEPYFWISISIIALIILWKEREAIKNVFKKD